MSLHRLSAGAGYQYLLRHTACGDVHRAATTPLTAYYTESGYPPGRWLGRGLSGVGLAAGGAVSEQQMAFLYGEGRNPVNGSRLGRAYPQFRSLSERIASRVESLPPDLGDAERADLVLHIQVREAARPSPCAVAGFDLTFTVPKSASVLWALAEPKTQEAITAAHAAALEAALAFFEERALFTRTGSAGCAQVQTRGMITAAFDHWDTRTGDPNLHTHVVVANKVQGEDGNWRSLDSRALHHAAVAVSELYDTVFPDELAKRLPLAWSWRDRGDRRSPAFEVCGVSDDLLSCFSTRSAQVDEAMTDLLRAFQGEHGRSPNRVEVLQLRQRATRATRPPKSLQPLPELMEKWRVQARERTGEDALKTAEGALGERNPLVSRKDIPNQALAELADRTLKAMLQRRATWTPWNVLTEASRTTRGLRMASTEDRQTLLDDVTAMVLGESIRLTPPDPVTYPLEYQRADGTSVFTRAGESKYSHRRILDAEARLLDANDQPSAPTVTPHIADRLARTPQRTSSEVVHLADDQVDAVNAIATSGLLLDVLVGPAGAGKTTTLRALRAAWETQHGRGSVVGLAPSSTAAHELAEALSIPCENTAKWMYETAREGAANLRWSLRASQLVIVDEASLAGTLCLDALLSQARAAGAKLLLVGDHRQLSAIDAGGAFGLLAERGNSQELRSLWRFRHRWEAVASRRLRRGDPEVLEEYSNRDRIRSGTAEVALEDAYLGWQDADRRGQSAILVAADGATVEALNHRAHEDRRAAGIVGDIGIELGPDAQRGVVSIGDRVVTRRNDRRLLVPGRGHVRNGALWTVISTAADGSLRVTPADRHVTHDCNPDPTVHVDLPAGYVQAHVELGYATTAHRAQGLTVDECHVLVSGSMSREALYVSMTRGRSANVAYVATDAVDSACDEIPDVHAVRTARQVLEQVLSRSGAELSATQERDRLLRDSTSPATLLPVRDTLLADADLVRWQPRLSAALGADLAAGVMSSPARGALLAALRRAEQRGLTEERLMNEVLGTRTLLGSHDIASVLHERLERWTIEHGSSEVAHVNQSSNVEGVIAELDALIDGRLAESEREHQAPDIDELAWRALLDRGEPAVER